MRNLWQGTAIAEYIKQKWPSASHRRMFALGQIAVKVAGMFPTAADDDAPEEARKAAALWLIGLESGNAAIYAELDAETSRLHAQWVAGRKLQ